MRVDEHTIELAGSPVFYRSAEPDGEPIVYLHGVPTSSDDWVAFLERTGGIAPDLTGFGRSGKGAHLDYSLAGHREFVRTLLGALAVDRARLVGHGWGAAVALALAQQAPHRFTRLVIIDAVPLLDGFTWPRIVRILRRPAIGELAMGSLTRARLARALRSASVSPAAWPAERVESVWQQFDQGTQRAILRIHRSAGEERLARAGERLGAITAPALVIWGEDDRWLPADLADRYAQRLTGASVQRLPGAGHWPWLDDPSAIDRVARFMGAR